MNKMTSDQMFDAVVKIRTTSGLNKKKALLSMYPDMQNILKTTYDPYKHFNVRVPKTWAARSNGTDNFSESTVRLLSQLLSGKLSGNAAKGAIQSEIMLLNHKSAQLLTLILNKGMDFGLAIKSINDVFPGLIPVHAVQRAKAYESGRCKFPCYVPPKLDGLRGTFKDGHFYSRNGHKFLGLSKLENTMKNFLDFRSWDVDGELMVPGEHFNEISGQIRAFTEADKAQFFAYDIVNSDQPLSTKLQLLNSVFLESSGKETEEGVYFLTHPTCHTEAEMFAMYDMHIEQGFEGSVVKQMDSTYKDARTWDWMKLKQTHTEDLVVTDIFEGRGKYAGNVGGLIVSFNGRDVRVGSGLTDKQRMYWMSDPEEIIGKTVEVAYHEVTPEGSLRHPRLKAVRGDK